MNHSSLRKLRFVMPFIVLAIVAAVTFAVYSLWNGVLVDVIAVKTITYWQALGILVLAKILFGGFPGRHGGPFGRMRESMMAKRWASLSPEERVHMRDEMRRRFGSWPRPPWCDEESEKPENPAKD